MAAFQNALTSELALIQGPPGTGKTYIGVQIVRYLLLNKSMWHKKGPILLVTYTNHALNQFITHIAKYTTQIIRIGGKQDDELLKQFGLREALFRVGKKHQYGKIRRQIEDAKRDINNLQSGQQFYRFGYLHSQIPPKDSYGELTLGTYSNVIMGQLKKTFAEHLNQTLTPYRKDQLFLIYMNQKIEKLREKSGNNILMMFWLGIIDLPAYVHFIYTTDYKNNVALKEEKEKKEADDELDENDQDALDERDKDYFKRSSKENAQAFDEKLEKNHKALIDAFSPEACCIQMKDKVETFGDALDFVSNHKFGRLTEAQLLKTLEQACNAKNFNALPVEARWAVNNYILAGLKTQIELSMAGAVRSYSEAQKRLEELDQLNAESIFKEAEIVAMTTTGRSKYSEYFKNVTFPIVIVEEAAEVFEAHIITGLSRHTDHLILIGDHQQLKPNPAVYDLDHNYNLSLSMFERLINNKIPHSTLSLQRRMRPEISKMMNLIYPDLKNHESVLKHPNIKGVSSSLYFFDHKFKESSNELMMSKVNVEEAEMVVRFAAFLLQNSYQPGNITILTLYAGQLLHIKQIVKNYKLLPELLKRIRVINVDNFQGEENDIILLSLVRSNPEGKLGFLKISNRVCVALSRARHGLFIFGNSNCLVGSKEKLWIDVVSYLKENGFFGDCLKFQCSLHKIATEVRNVNDFHKIPEGGCNRPCESRLECGHSCGSVCHPFEQTALDPTGHRQKQCRKNCAKPRLCGHPCTYKCYECKQSHQPCLHEIERIMSPCGHNVKLQCRQNTPDFRCPAPCSKTLQCGHQCKAPCSVGCYTRPCKENITRKLPSCEHEVEMQCYEDPLTFECYKPCGFKLPCGHPCQAKCKDCKKAGFHQLCQKQCGKNLICGHNCKDKCTLTCSPCQSECYTKCPHSKCKLKCGEVCVPCLDECSNRCEHTRCTMRCYQPCNREPCNTVCTKDLQCGHKCVGLCGERCPKACRQCKPQDEAFTTIILGNEGLPDARYIELDCGHTFEVSDLDRYMEQPQTVIKYRECPRCRQPINKTGRYMKQINQTLNDLNLVKGLIQEAAILISARLNQVKTYIDRYCVFYAGQYGHTALSKCIQQLFDHTSTVFTLIERQRNVADLNTLIDDLGYAFNLQLISEFYNKMRYKANMDQQLQKNVDVIVMHIKDALTQKLVTPFHREQGAAMVNALRRIYPADMGKELFNIEKLRNDIMSNNWHKCANKHIYTVMKSASSEDNQKCPNCGVGGSKQAAQAMPALRPTQAHNLISNGR